MRTEYDKLHLKVREITVALINKYYRHLLTSPDYEDVLQEVSLAFHVIQLRDPYDSAFSLTSRVFKILRFATMRQYTLYSDRRRYISLDGITIIQPSTQRQIETSASLALLEPIISKALSPQNSDKQLAFQQVFIEDKRTKDIARKLNKSPKQIASYNNYSLKLIRKALELKTPSQDVL